MINRAIRVDDLSMVILFGTVIKYENGIRTIMYNNKKYEISEETITYLDEVYFNNL